MQKYQPSINPETNDKKQKVALDLWPIFLGFKSFYNRIGAKAVTRL